MRREIHLGLYGTIPHGPKEDLAWDLYQTEALARLRDISLSSTPSRFIPHSSPASRFQHSVGVSVLVRRLCELRPHFRPYRSLLIGAALCHDAGSPPFSHIAEVFLYQLTGRTHEQQLQELLQPNGELAAVLEHYEVDPQEVLATVCGRQRPVGELVAGSIDLDNCDNSVHLLSSYGYHAQLPYHPLELIGAFDLIDGRLVLDSAYLHPLLGWAEARRQLYGILEGEVHLSAATMLYRALELAFARGALDERFFWRGESDALYALQTDCGEDVGELVGHANRWRHYPLLYRKQQAEADPRVAAIYSDWQARFELANRIASELDLPPHHLAVYVGRCQKEKRIHLPFVGPRAEAAARLFPGSDGQQLVAVFCHKRHLTSGGETLRRRAACVVEQVLAELPEPSGTDASQQHVFF